MSAPKRNVSDPEVVAAAWDLARHDAAGAIAQIGKPKLGASAYLLEAFIDLERAEEPSS